VGQPPDDGYSTQRESRGRADWSRYVDLRLRIMVRHILDILRFGRTPLYKSRVDASSRGAPPYAYPTPRIVPQAADREARSVAAVSREAGREPPPADPPTPTTRQHPSSSPAAHEPAALGGRTPLPHSPHSASSSREVSASPTSPTSPTSPVLLPSSPPPREKAGGVGVGGWSRRETPLPLQEHRPERGEEWLSPYHSPRLSVCRLS
jgi:hypothetical protein